MTREEAKSCIQTIELLRRLAFNVHGVMDVIDVENCDKIIAMLSQEPCEDCISRQAVLMELGKYLCGVPFDEKGIDEVIKDLPPVNPQPKTGWIPVSEERLPKGSDIVLLSLPPHINPNGEDCSASVICGHYIGGKDKEWGLSDGDTFGYGLVSVKKGTNPIAWMPLPKPYELQESEVSE